MLQPPSDEQTHAPRLYRCCPKMNAEIMSGISERPRSPHWRRRVKRESHCKMQCCIASKSWKWESALGGWPCWMGGARREVGVPSSRPALAA